MSTKLSTFVSTLAPGVNDPPFCRAEGPCYTPAARPASVPHSSRGLGHRPLKAEITGSNPVCGTNLAPIGPIQASMGRIQSRDQIMDEALTRLGMPVPDSALARRARELITDVAAPFLVNHSVRSYAWAVELARHDRLEFDPEVLYVSAMLHDIGLVPAYD